MTVVLAAMGVAFAVFTMWLTVRLINRREDWAKLTMLAFAALSVLYPLSLEPARELVILVGNPKRMTAAAEYVYAPLFLTWRHSPDWLRTYDAEYCLWWGHRPGPPF